MASALYRCQCTTLHHDQVVIRCHPTGATDNGPPADPGLALMMIYEPVLSGERVACALGQVVGPDDILDPAWHQRHARALITAVEASVTSEDPLEVTLSITASDPRWVNHLVDAEPWDSYACVLTPTYDEPGVLPPSAENTGRS